VKEETPGDLGEGKRRFYASWQGVPISRYCNNKKANFEKKKGNPEKARRGR